MRRRSNTGMRFLLPRMSEFFVQNPLFPLKLSIARPNSQKTENHGAPLSRTTEGLLPMPDTDPGALLRSRTTLTRLPGLDVLNYRHTAIALMRYNLKDTKFKLRVDENDTFDAWDLQASHSMVAGPMQLRWIKSQGL